MEYTSRHNAPPAQFGLHFGQIIKTYIDSNPSITQTKVAGLMELSKTGLRSKFESSTFGTIYDLIKLSIVLEHDFVSMARTPLKSKGIAIETEFEEQQYLELKERVASLEKDLVDRKREIDLLYEKLDQKQ